MLLEVRGQTLDAHDSDATCLRLLVPPGEESERGKGSGRRRAARSTPAASFPFRAALVLLSLVRRPLRTKARLLQIKAQLRLCLACYRICRSASQKLARPTLMVHARATIRPRCLRLPLPPVATSSCRLPCRRLASSSAALAVKPVQSTPIDGLRKVRRLPSLKPAAQVVRSTVKGSSRVGSETRPPTPPARLESGSSSSSGRPTGHSSSERVRAAEARAQPEVRLTRSIM